MTRASVNDWFEKHWTIVALLASLVGALGWQAVSPNQRMTALERRVAALEGGLKVLDAMALDRCLSTPPPDIRVQIDLDCEARTRRRPVP